MNRLLMATTKSLIIAALLVQTIINLVHRWQSHKERHAAQQDCQQQRETAAIIEEEFQREEDFQMWYAHRVHQSRIILPEAQVRRLYDAYLSNMRIIKSQVASEVVE